MIASHYGHVGVVKVLLENDAQVDLRDIKRQSSLMIASECGYVDVCLKMMHRCTGRFKREQRMD